MSTKTLIVDGQEITVEERGIVKNWGPFFDRLTKIWDDLDDKRNKATDPYLQYILNEQKALVLKIRKSYENFLGTISNRRFISINDVGLPWLRELEVLLASITLESNQLVEKSTVIRSDDQNEYKHPNYIQASYRAKIELVKQIVKEFQTFSSES